MRVHRVQESIYDVQSSGRIKQYAGCFVYCECERALYFVSESGAFNWIAGSWTDGSGYAYQLGEMIIEMLQKKSEGNGEYIPPPVDPSVILTLRSHGMSVKEIAELRRNGLL